MTCRKLVALAAALGVMLLASGAAAETTHLRSPSTCQTDGGSSVRFPPGVFVPDPDWLRIDTEVRRLQDAETRLGAENRVLRDAAGGGRFRLVLGVVAGAVLGFALGKAL